MAKKGKKKDYFKIRLNLVLLCVGLVAATILVRAFVFAGLESEKLARLAHQESYQTVTLGPERGLIYDRRGVELAVSVQVGSVYARPKRIKDKQATVRQLAKALKMKQRTVAKLISRKKPFVWLKRRVSPELAEKVVKLKLPGVGVKPENRRFYPNRELAAHLLGFTGIDTNGLEGLEKGFDTVLRGQTSRFSRKRDAWGRPIYVDAEELPPSTRGHDLVLTIDKRIQYITQKALAGAVSQHRAKGGMALVLDPTSGEILASAAVPEFNPNVHTKSHRRTWRNRIVTDPFEPGSTFKIFTLASALQTGLFSPGSRINCENGAYKVGGHIIHDTHKYQTLSLADVLQVSSNIGAAKVALAMGRKRLHRSLTRFGFGRATGCDLPGESAGLMASAKRWRKIDLANIAFGQGIAVTALQLTSAVGAVANRGVLMKPFAVREIKDHSGRVIERREVQSQGRVISAGTAQTMIRLMENVVTDDGTAPRARVRGYRVAGKTGTAQKLDAATGTYSNKKYTGLFVGLAPADDPALVVLVVIDEPQGSHFGGVVAAPAFARIMGQALPLLGVAPSRKGPIRVEAPTPESKMAGLRPPRPSEISRARKQKQVPPLVGLPLRQAIEVVNSFGLEPRIEGRGVVTWQFPNPGTRLRGVKAVRLKLEAEA